MAKSRWWRGLLARVTLTYAFGALLLSSTVTGATFVLAQNRLLAFRESELRQQAYSNSEDLNVRLESIPEDAETQVQDDLYTNALEDLLHPNGSQPLILLPDGGFKAEVLRRSDIPTDIVEKIRRGTDVADQRYAMPDGVPAYIVGVALDDILYFEVLRLTELEDTLK